MYAFSYCRKPPGQCSLFLFEQQWSFPSAEREVAAKQVVVGAVVVAVLRLMEAVSATYLLRI